MRDATAKGTLSPDEVASIRRTQAMDVIFQRGHEPGFSVAAVASKLHISIRQLYRSFSGYIGPAELIARRRTASTVVLLLVDPELPVGDISSAAGFTDPTTLRDNLHRYAGMGTRALRLAIQTTCGPRHFLVTPETVITALREPQSAWIPVSVREG